MLRRFPYRFRPSHGRPPENVNTGKLEKHHAFMIEFDRVAHAFDGRSVLKDISLKLGQRRIGVIGANGSGKSTFARMLNGLLVPNTGAVRIDGLDSAKNGKAVRRKVGFVFQNPDNQIVFPVVEEDIAFGLKNLKLPRDEIERKVDAIVKRYGLEALRTRSSHLLSGGEKQMLALSSVLVMEPDYIVFDEPTTLLDLRNKRRVMEVIHGLEQTVIMITHDLDLLADFDRVLVFDEGRLAIDAAPQEAIAFYLRAMSAC